MNKTHTLIFLLFTMPILTIINSCAEEVSIYEGQWINDKGEVLTIKKLDEMYFTVKGCPAIKEPPLYITGNEIFTAIRGNDGNLYIDMMCVLTIRNEQLNVKYLFKKKPFL